MIQIVKSWFIERKTARCELAALQDDVIEDAYSIARQFFELPFEEKSRCDTGKAYGAPQLQSGEFSISYGNRMQVYNENHIYSHSSLGFEEDENSFWRSFAVILAQGIQWLYSPWQRTGECNCHGTPRQQGLGSQGHSAPGQRGIHDLLRPRGRCRPRDRRLQRSDATLS